MKIPEFEIDEQHLADEIKSAAQQTVRDQVWHAVRSYGIERMVRDRVNALVGTVIDDLIADALSDSDKLKTVVEEALKRKIADKLQKERAKQAKASE
jgi:hypothetical protein